MKRRRLQVFEKSLGIELLEAWLLRTRITRRALGKQLGTDGAWIAGLSVAKHIPSLERAYDIKAITGIDPEAWITPAASGEVFVLTQREGLAKPRLYPVAPDRKTA